MRFFYTLLMMAFFILGAGSKGCDDNAKNSIEQNAKNNDGETFSKCEKDEDCVLIKESCCDCNAGGARISVARIHARALLNKRQEECHDKACMQVISSHPSCGKKAACEQGSCALK